MTPSPSEAARLAVYCYGAESVGPVEMPAVPAQDGAGAAISSGGPPLPEWMAKRLTLLGWATGQDALLEGWLDLDPRRVFYGWLCQDEAGEPVLIIRGTQSFAEWAIDAEALPESVHPVAGEVETGFWSLFGTLELRSLNGVDRPLVAGIKAALRRTDTVTVTGHSLGAAEAVYATLALAKAGCRVRGRFIAPPRAGDRELVAAFNAGVIDYAAYAYASDIVPKIPRGLGYAPLRDTITIPQNPAIPDTLADNHHALSYAYELDPAALDMLPDWRAAAPWITP